ncbi:MAG: HNH endonuclease, partial [Thermoguttaceae bacterium]
TGHSIADANFYITDQRPPKPGQWGHATSFYRVPLHDYCPFDEPIPLATIFTHHGDRLTQYHQMHSPANSRNGRFLFYVPQAGRLQCQNGAYLSEIDAELTEIIFGNATSHQDFQSVRTGFGIAMLHTRIGQQAFSEAVRENYSEQCCFPCCPVNDRAFLVGAHIARWSDSPELRGNVANGLCFCLMHDKAFEDGLFVLDPQFRVMPTPFAKDSPWAITNILPFANQQIKIGQVQPALTCLQLHWRRVGHAAWPKFSNLGGKDARGE